MFASFLQIVAKGLQLESGPWAAWQNEWGSGAFMPDVSVYRIPMP